jgi:hypothetical protein
MQRLRRIVSQLEPQVRSLFRRRTSGILLRARLTYWRVRHRLSSLTVDRQGGSRVRVIARLNPWLPTGEGLMPTGEDLRLIVHDAARAVLNHPDVIRRSNEMAAESGREDQPLTVEGGIGWPAAVREMNRRRMATSGPTASRYYRVGGGRVVEQRTRGVVVRGPGSYSRRDPRTLQPGQTMPTSPPTLIANQVDDIRRATGLTSGQLTNMVRTFARTGTLPPALDAHRSQIASLTLLMFGRESARSTANLAFAPMTLDLMGQGQMTWNEATRGHEGHVDAAGNVRGGALGFGGAFPMSMQGAPEAAAELERQRRAQEGGRALRPRPARAQALARELARREIALAERWLRAQMQAEGLHGFASRADALEFITERLLRFYRMRSLNADELPQSPPTEHVTAPLRTPLRGLLEAAGFRSSRRR